jgi:hypothetical protein
MEQKEAWTSFERKDRPAMLDDNSQIRGVLPFVDGTRGRGLYLILPHLRVDLDSGSVVFK